MHLPTPQQRPDLYDDFDYPERPAGWVNPVSAQLPAELQQRIDRKRTTQPNEASGVESELQKPQQ